MISYHMQRHNYMMVQRRKPATCIVEVANNLLSSHDLLAVVSIGMMHATVMISRCLYQLRVTDVTKPTMMFCSVGTFLDHHSRGGTGMQLW